MKSNYESKKIIYVFMVIIFLFFIICIIYLFGRKISLYKVFNSVVVKENLVVLVVSNNDLDLFYSNSYIFINDKKIKFKIVKVNKNIIERDNDLYSEIYLKFKFNKKREKDIIELSIFDRKIYSFKMFEVIWR